MRIYRPLILVVLLAMLLAGCGGGAGEAAPTVTPVVADIPDDLPSSDLADEVKNNPKIATVIQRVLQAYKEGGREEALKEAQRRKLLDKDNNLLLQIVLDTDDPQLVQDTSDLLAAEDVIIMGTLGSRIDVAIPPTILEKVRDPQQRPVLIDNLTKIDHVKYIDVQPDLSPKSVPAAESTEGVQVIEAQRWHEQGFKGQGIKVGIIDYGFTNYKDQLGTTLPPKERVITRSFVFGLDVDEAEETHGTMVAEVIHALAPEATLYFAYVNSLSGISDAAQWLQSQGVRVINHSGGAPIGPFDGTNDLELFIDQIVDEGILWVNSAGNDGSAHWRGDFNPDDEGWHIFQNGRRTICVTGFFRGISLHWWETPDNDFDLYLFKQAGKKLQQVDYSVNAQPDFPPTEWIPPFENNFECYYVGIMRASGDNGPAKLDLFVSNMVQGVDPAVNIREHSVTNPGTSKNALSVGAVLWNNDEEAVYSSEGPTSDGRLKPEISAPSEVSTSQGSFGGTSAASPHVAGAAALVLSANPDLTVDELKDLLRKHAKDLGPSGPDQAFGDGRLFLGNPEDVLGKKRVEDPVPTPEDDPGDKTVVFEDTYDDSASGLSPEGSGDGWSSGYDGGHYRLTASFADRSQFNLELYEGQRYRDMYLAVDIEERPSTGKSAGYGILFGVQDSDNYYQIQRQGESIALYKRAGDNTLKLGEGALPKRRLRFLRLRQLHIELVAQGGAFEVWVNGQQAFTAEDQEPFTNGQIGLWVTNEGENRLAEVWFDNLFVEGVK
jgi:subtilisin family serine protease